jgi:hypothetical protein
MWWKLMSGEDGREGSRWVSGRMCEWWKEGGSLFVNILGNSWSIEDGPLLYFYCKHNHIHIHDHNIYLDIPFIPYTNDIHLTAPDMPSQIPTLFSPCPLSLFHLHLYSYPHAQQGGQSALSFKVTRPFHFPRCFPRTSGPKPVCRPG